MCFYYLDNFQKSYKFISRCFCIFAMFYFIGFFSNKELTKTLEKKVITHFIFFGHFLTIFFHCPLSFWTIHFFIFFKATRRLSTKPWHKSNFKWMLVMFVQDDQMKTTSFLMVKTPESNIHWRNLSISSSKTTGFFKTRHLLNS